MSEIAVRPETSTVVISVKVKTGEIKSQEIQLQHKPGQAPGELMYAALDIFKRIGGIVEDTPDGINVYLPATFDGPLSFSLKTIVLA